MSFDFILIAEIDSHRRQLPIGHGGEPGTRH